MNKFQQSQKGKIFKPDFERHDQAQRPHHSALCVHCGAFYQAGHWSWQDQVPLEVESVTCPACQRIADDEPAGVVHLSGSFLRGHQDEVLSLIRHTEAHEKAEHALERILKVHNFDDHMDVTTTGIHLANRIGHALNAAYKGTSQYHYSDNDTRVSVSWQRD